MSIPHAASVSACHLRRWTVVVLFTVCSVAHVVAVARPAAAQSSSVTTAADLATAIQAANAWAGSGPYTINFQGGITVQPTAQMIIGLALSNTAGLVVNGNGATIDMSQANGGAGDRAFFVADGTVAFNNLRIANGRAVGGNGGGGAGGGAGLGGGIFVANSGSIQGVPALPTFVTLSGVEFLGNAAVGGAGGAASNQNYDPSSNFLPWSGGGGMGGNGGQGYIGGIDTSGGGGGGFGFGASGGNASSDGEPGVAGALVVTLQGGGGGGYNGAAGGATGGGGGGGNDGLFERGAGGGGGAGGLPANGSSGGDGRFGGGGGGAGDDRDNAGDGGFGGGGGSGEGTPGSGGFGGGGGAGYDGVGSTSAAQLGGFGGGGGAAMFTNGGPSGSVTVALGGGGAGLGGAVFVMNGATLAVDGLSSFAGNTVTSGSGYALVLSVGGTFSSANGSAYGPDLFVGGNVVLSPGHGQMIFLTSLGGAGNLADPNVAPSAADPNANGSFSVTGGGLVTLGGTSFLSGAITVNTGTLALAPNAVEKGAASVTVGQNAGDVATLQLGSSSTLTLAGFPGSDQPVVIARDAGSIGTVMIGDGPGSSGADIGARVFAGGAGNATIEFAQQYAAGSTSDPVYPFFTTITGSVGIVQAGPGTTLLQPLYGANTFSGAVLIESGTLATSGTAAALGGISSISVGPHAGLLLGQSAGVADGASLTLADGALRTTAALTEKLGPLVVTGSSVIDFLGNAATLEFSALSLGGRLAIWNYSLPIDFLRIDSGTATGSLSQIAFYSDSGVTYLGEGMFSDTYYLVPAPSTPEAVPEIGLGGFGPAVALVAGVCGLIERRRRRVGSTGHEA